MLHHFIGFHGTSFDNAINITQGSFQPSKGNTEWLGDGVYFFIEGINRNPAIQAEKWAIAQSWDSDVKENRYDRVSVIKSDIIVEDDFFLDLTSNNGVEILSYVIEKYQNKLLSIGKKLKYLDGLIINFIRGEGILNIQVVRGNFYIKFTNERINKINLRIPNTTICAVFDPKINLNNSVIISNKDIRDETY